MTTKTRLLNRSAVRDKALAVLAHERPHLAAKFTRISGDFFARMEGQLIYAMENYIRAMPSVGKTLK